MILFQKLFELGVAIGNRLFPKLTKNVLVYERVLKFIIAGGSCGVLDVLGLFLLVHFVGINYLIASVLAFLVAFIFSFYLQKNWTFRDKTSHATHTKIAKYLLMQLCALVLNTALMYFFVSIFGVWYILSQIIISLCIAVLSYTINKLIIFDADSMSSEKNVSKKPTVLIASPLFPPEIGGPSQYAKKLSDAFVAGGHSVLIATYGRERHLPLGIRHIVYLLKSVHKLIKTDVCIALDTFSVALPMVLLCKILKKKIVIRIGGDFLWEQYIERTDKKIILREFYKTDMSFLSRKEKIIFNLTKWLLKESFALVFSTKWQKDIWLKPYQLEDKDIYVIENYFGKKLPSIDSTRKVFVAGARNIKLKNLQVLHRAFEVAQMHNPEIVLDVQNFPYDGFLSHIQKSYVVILVSLSDISPNMVMDAVRCGKPFIVTRETGLYDRLKDVGIFVDPFNEKGISEQILRLADDKEYDKIKRQVNLFHYEHDWMNIANEFLEIINHLNLK